MGYIRDRWKDPARKGKGKRWQVKYRVDGREKDGGSYDTKAIAQRKLVELEAAVQRGQWVDPTDRTTVTEYARQWAAHRPHRPTTAKRVARQIDRQIAVTPLGSRRLASVRPSDVQAWVASLTAQGLAPSSVQVAVRVLAAVFNAAVADHLVAVSPVKNVALPRPADERVVPLTIEQVRTLAEAMPPRCKAMVYAQAGLGLRIGELLALRVQDVDFLRRTVRVEHQLERGTRARVEPKTPRSRRTVPLPRIVAEQLAAHIAAYPPLAADGLLFYGTNEQPWEHTMYGSRIFAKVTGALASAKSSTFPVGITTHDLRHHFASVLLAAGESVVAVAERLGHEDATLVLRVYGHLLPDSEDRTRKALDAAWDAAGPSAGGAATAQGRPE